MNPFLNPLFLTRIAKGYLFDVSRLKRFSTTQLQSFQNKQLKKIVNHALKVPIYQRIYKKQGINKNDVTTIDDLKKLPIISKEDFAECSASELIPINKGLSDFVKVSTSGTTGKSLSIYVDMYEIIIGLFGYLRTINDYQISFWKDKLSIIGDFAPHTAESGYIKRGLLPNMIMKNAFKSIQWLDTNRKPEDIIEQLDYFKPQFIGGYTGMLGHLAVLKTQGKGKQVQPKLIASTGALLDPKLKQFIKDSFQSEVFEVYGATETGPIAYQCKKQGIYHIMSDLLHLEFIDENGEPVSSKTPGHLLVTKLFGGGTPIIRYNAINDIVSPLYEPHHCGVSGDLIHRIFGRDKIRLFRSDGKIVLASSLTSIFSRLLYELQTSKIRDIKVIQHNLNKIEIKVVVDESLRHSGPSLDDIFSVFEQGFKEKFGSSVSIFCHEVSEVSREEPRIISHVDPSVMEISGFI